MAKCGGFHVQRSGKFGAFFGCTNYPDCRATTKFEDGQYLIGMRVYGVQDDPEPGDVR